MSLCKQTPESVVALIRLIAEQDDFPDIFLKTVIEQLQTCVPEILREYTTMAAREAATKSIRKPFNLYDDQHFASEKRDLEKMMQSIEVEYAKGTVLMSFTNNNTSFTCEFHPKSENVTWEEHPDPFFPTVITRKGQSNPISISLEDFTVSTFWFMSIKNAFVAAGEAALEASSVGLHLRE